MVNVFLLLGGNMGNRQLYLQKAIGAIEKNIGTVVKRSAVYETQSWGKSNQPDYLNQVIIVQTVKPAQDVLKQLLEIEKHMGRVRVEKWGSRIIDIDILFYGEEVIDIPELIVPHPEIQNRGFTLAPLAEIAPDMQHPVLKKSVLQLKKELTDTLNIKKL